MQVVQHNLLSQFANRQLNITNNKKAKATERLSSGYRINRSADDAAGLQISEKMRWQIRGLNKASQNIQDGISFVQTGEGALNEVHSMMQRIRELAVQAANDTNTSQDRAALDQEVQNIKDEISHVFRDTMFNTKYIFRAPYTPEIENEPQDYQMFNVGAGGAQTGGVLINNKRYTWEELGLNDWTTPSDSDRDKLFYDNVTDKWGNTAKEKILLRLKAGDTLPAVNRVYEMTADNTGIMINDVYAGKWNDGTIAVDGTHYSFSHNGTNISFDAEPGDTQEDVITNLNRNQISVVSWDAVASGSDSWSAVHSTGDSMTLYVTNENKGVAAGLTGSKGEIERWQYSVVADQQGVGIVQQNYQVSDGISHTKTNWSNFTNTAGSPAYPIVDYGTSSSDPYNRYDPVASESVSNNPVTVDADAVYHYTDTTSARMPDQIAFDFNVRDEVGKTEAIAGLTQTLTGSAVQAPIKSVTVQDSSTVSVKSYDNITFHFQRDQLLRDFGTDGNDAAMNTTVVRTKHNAGTFDSYENRKVLQEAYARWTTDTRSRTTTYTGTIKVNSDDSYDASTFSQTGSNTSAWSTVEKTAEYQALTNQVLTDTSTGSTNTTTSDYSEVAGSRFTGGDGNTYATVTYTVKESYDYSYYKNEGAYIKNGSNYTYAGKSTYVYEADGYDASKVGSTLFRDNNSQVYHVVSSYSSDSGVRRYASINSEEVLDKTYEVNYYTYEMQVTKPDNTVMTIMTGKSTNFIDTGRATTILDSQKDYDYDKAHAANGSAITQQLAAENVDGTIGIHGYQNLIVGGTSYVSGNLTTDQAVRDIALTGKDADNETAKVVLTYNDTQDENDSLNKTEKTRFTPDGKAYRTFTKAEQNAGSAVEVNFKTKINPPEKLLHIQAGAKGGQSIDLRWPALNNSIVGISNTSLKTYGQASAAIDEMDDAIGMISEVRTRFGVQQNRLEYAMAIDDNTAENTQAAESRLRDADMASEMVEYSKHDILAQAGQAMLSQANQQPQGILSLLQ